MAAKPFIPKAASQSSSIPVPKEKIEDKAWTFSFRYWQQRDNFGLDVPKVDPKWFASFLSRLRELSARSIEKFLADHKEQKAWRYHKINWNQPNIPITRKEFESIVPAGMISDETDICQFTVSTANGRVVGFFDHQQVFQIVLLDPLHNIQPAKDYNYAVNPTKVALTEIEFHKEKMKLVIKEAEVRCGADCGVKEMTAAILEIPLTHRLFCLNDYCSEADIAKLLESHESIEAIVLNALAKLLEAS